jgi:hypothetical protein
MADMVVAYRYPVAGGTPPTALVMSKRLQVTADIASDGTDDPTVVTHNFGVSVDGSDGQPVIKAALTLQGATAVMPTISFNNANSVLITRNAAGATANFTLRLTLERRQ